MKKFVLMALLLCLSFSALVSAQTTAHFSVSGLHCSGTSLQITNNSISSYDSSRLLCVWTTSGYPSSDTGYTPHRVTFGIGTQRISLLILDTAGTYLASYSDTIMLHESPYVWSSNWMPEINCYGDSVRVTVSSTIVGSLIQRVTPDGVYVLDSAIDTFSRMTNVVGSELFRAISPEGCPCPYIFAPLYVRGGPDYGFMTTSFGLPVWSDFRSDTSGAMDTLFKCRSYDRYDSFYSIGHSYSWADTFSNRDSNYHYLWGTGETTREVRSNRTGVYSCTITSPRGCSVSKSVYIINDTVHNYTLASFYNLGRDTVCGAEMLYLSTYAFNIFTEIGLTSEWSSSDARDSFSYTEHYFYAHVSVSNTPGIHTIYHTVWNPWDSTTTVDSLKITVAGPATIPFITRDTTLNCSESMTLYATHDSLSILSWHWFEDGHDTSLTSDSLHIGHGGWYTAVAVNIFGCSLHTEYVNIMPISSPISGAETICRGLSSLMHTAVAGGTWTSSNTAIAMIGSTTGLVNGVATGSAVITYTVSGGCIATKTISVVTSLPSLTGPSSVCVGQTITLSSSVSGGVWSSSAPTIATVGTSTGVVTGVAGNLHTSITYTVGATCRATQVVSVNPLSSIVGPSTLCQGTPATYTDATAGGVWTSTNTAGATIGSTSGIADGLSAGTIVIVYTLPTGCGSFKFVTVSAYAPITGAHSVCNGQNVTLANAISDGVWSSSAPTIAAVGTSTGVVMGMAGNLSANITYTFSSGCRATYGVTVNALSPISAPTSVCQGTPATLTDATAGGTWSSSDRTIATIGSTTGILTGLSGGMATIAYNLPNGCVAISHPNINPIAVITGTNRVCVGSTTTLSASLSGGAWSTSTPTIATVGSTGVVTGIAGGLASNISYTMSTGCRATMMMSVTALPSVGAITGASSVATGASITLSDATTGGRWSSGNIARAIIGTSTGVVTGISAGLATITYTVTNTFGCNNFATKNVTVGATAPQHNNSTEIVGTKSVEEVQLFPNPNNGEFMVRGKTSANEITFEVYDLLGRILLNSIVTARDGNINEQIQLSNTVPNGTYLLVLRSEGTISTVTFAKQ